MGMRLHLWGALYGVICGSSLGASAQNLPDRHLKPDGFGMPATATELRTRANLVFPSGDGLPSGQGTVNDGAVLYASRCLACHGLKGRGGSGGELAGGNPDLEAKQPDKTIGSYWPYATTLFDFIRRAMPLDAPWSLTNVEVYALVAYLLHLNGLVGADYIANAASMTALKMPNRDGFVPIDAAWPAGSPQQDMH